VRGAVAKDSAGESQGDKMATKSSTLAAALIAVAAVTSAIAQQPDYQPPPPSYQPPPPSYQPPPPSYQPPPPSYQPPPPSYQQPPPPSYQPPPAYQQPAPNYQQPPPSYQPPRNYQQAPPPYQQQPPGNYPQPQPPNYQQQVPNSQPPPRPSYQQSPTPQKSPTWVHSVKQLPPTFSYHPLRVQIEGGYTVPLGGLKDTLHGGGNIGAGLTWFPIKELPIGFRFDGSYSRFDYTQQALNAASTATGTNVVIGRQNVYGGDADIELDLPMGSSVREYFFGGFGWYRQQTIFKQGTFEQGLICYFYCAPGVFPVVSTVERSTTPWERSWNAGMGFEFALSDPASFFIEARYLRIQPYSANQVFIPIRVGLRF
jgi:opacity protein-like surface antigen